MSSVVDLVTFCCPKDVERLYANGQEQLIRLFASSGSIQFGQFLVVHQQCDPPTELTRFNDVPVRQLRLTDPRAVALKYATDPEDVKLADDHCGEGHHHVWFRHMANHLFAAEHSEAEYIVFFDCDCYIKETTASRNWIDEGIVVLENYPQVLFVCPNWGQGAGESVQDVGNAHFHKTTSQQVILIRRETLLNLDWAAKWTWDMPKAPGQPDAWFYWVLEGRLWRHMRDHDMYRASLKNHRWWHLQWH